MCALLIDEINKIKVCEFNFDNTAPQKKWSVRRTECDAESDSKIRIITVALVFSSLQSN